MECLHNHLGGYSWEFLVGVWVAHTYNYGLYKGVPR